ncbi:MAG: right-handed parallel beta-helix repeat-containing protein [Gammaproteobacteria bacterium]
MRRELRYRAARRTLGPDAAAANELFVTAPNATGIELASSNNNTITSNDANSQLSAGMEVQNSASNRLLVNTANSNNADGIDVNGSAGVASNLLDGDLASNNKGNGIVVAYGGNTIRNNIAR